MIRYQVIALRHDVRHILRLNSYILRNSADNGNKQNQYFFHAKGYPDACLSCQHLNLQSMKNVIWDVKSISGQEFLSKKDVHHARV